MLDREYSLDNSVGLLEAHRPRLRALIGKRVEATWVAWDLDRDEWFTDEAVIVEAEGVSLEIVCWKLSDIALSWNRIETDRRPNWVAEWSTDFSLEWRRDAIVDLRDSVGRRILGINVVEYLFRTTVVEDRRQPSNVGRQDEAWLLHGLEFLLERKTVGVFNALDQNGVGTEPFVGEEYRRIAV